MKNGQSSQGPLFHLVDEIGWHQLERGGGFGSRTRPLLIKGAVKMWPARGKKLKVCGIISFAAWVGGVAIKASAQNMRQRPLIDFGIMSSPSAL